MKIVLFLYKISHLFDFAIVYDVYELAKSLHVLLLILVLLITGFR